MKNISNGRNTTKDQTVKIMKVIIKSSKRAWDDEQDLKLLKMIAEIGPHQWE